MSSYLLNITAIVSLLFSSTLCFADSSQSYKDEEKAGLDVPEEFKLKYQVPSEWLLVEDESDFLGGTSSLRGNAAMQYRYFSKDGLSESQSQNELSFSLEPEYSLSWPNENLFVATPFLQYDSQDSSRSYFDIRELYGMAVGDEYEFSLGLRKIFWGVTESQNLVDIINQEDHLSTDSNSDKLGQPMLNLTLLKEWGTLNLFILPFFREAEFPSEDGRLRSAIPINSDNAQYESGSENTHLDYAVRYNHYWGDLELGLSYFGGTARTPGLTPTDFEIHPDLHISLPNDFNLYYYQMSQIGIDLQYILGGWLLKAEFIDQSNKIEDYQAWTTGVEYTFTGIFDTELDLSIIAEWLYDTRQYDESSLSYTHQQVLQNPYGKILPPPVYENDIMFGLRLAFNDVRSSEISFGVISDIDQPVSVWNLEATRRLTDHWKIKLEAFMVESNDNNDAFYDLRDDDYISCRLSYFF